MENKSNKGVIIALSIVIVILCLCIGLLCYFFYSVDKEVTIMEDENTTTLTNEENTNQITITGFADENDYYNFEVDKGNKVLNYGIEIKNNKLVWNINGKQIEDASIKEDIESAAVYNFQGVITYTITTSIKVYYIEFNIVDFEEEDSLKSIGLTEDDITKLDYKEDWIYDYEENDTPYNKVISVEKVYTGGIREGGFTFVLVKMEDGKITIIGRD